MDTQEILFTALAAFSFIFIIAAKSAKPEDKEYYDEPGDNIY